MYKLLPFLLLFFFSCSKPKQNSTKYDFNNFDIYEQINNKSSFLDSLYNGVNSKENDSIKREYLLKIASRYNWLEQDLKFRDVISLLQNLSIKAKDTLILAKTYHLYGNFYDERHISDSAYYCYLKAEKLYSNTKDNNYNLAKILLYKANILYSYSIYSESEKAVVNALQILDNSDNTRLKYEANVMMSLIQDDLKQYDISLKYYTDTSRLLDKLEKEQYDKKTLQRSWLSYHNNIASFYNETNQLAFASDHIEKALNSPHIEDYPKLKAMLLNNYASNKAQLGKDPSLIDSLYLASYNITKDINHKQGIANNILMQAKYSLSRNDTVRAITQLKESLTIALDQNYGYELKESLKLLSLYDKQEKNKYTALYIKTQDSLNLVELQTRNNFARIEFETNKIEKQNSLLNRINSFQFISILLLSMLLLIFVISYRLKVKNTRLINWQKEQDSIQKIQTLLLQQQSITGKAINTERQRIANDLHDSVINRVFTSRLNLQDLDTTDLVLKNKILNQLQITEQHIRDIAHNIHKYLLNPKQQYSEIINKLVNAQRNSFNTEFTSTIDKQIDWDIFSIQEKTHIYLILQELLHNVNKHSRASKSMVFFFKDDTQILLRVIDNGIGFSLNKQKQGLGYKSILSRLRHFEATLDIQIINQMTTISIAFNIENKTSL